MEVLAGSPLVFSLASFTLVPRVDTAEKIEEKQVFRNAEKQKTPAKKPTQRKMDMKKRVSLELRHRSPTEVSNPVCFLVFLPETLRCKLDRPEKEESRAHGSVSAAPEKCSNICKNKLRAHMKSCVQLNTPYLYINLTSGGVSFLTARSRRDALLCFYTYSHIYFTYFCVKTVLQSLKLSLI